VKLAGGLGEGDAMRISRLLLRPFRALRGDRSGAALIEFAAVATVLIALLLPLTDIGMGFYVKSQVMTAAQAGAQWAYLNGWATNNQTAQTDMCTAVTNASGLGNSNSCTGSGATCNNTGADALICSSKPTVNDTTLSTPAPNFQLQCFCTDATTGAFSALTPGVNPWTVANCIAQTCASPNIAQAAAAYVTVRTRYVYQPLIPYDGFSFVWGPGTGSGITLQSQATIRITPQ
jgi:Flp pilus assembly protein TadG